MAKITIQNEEGQNLNRYKMVPVDGQANTYDLERAANITKQGTPFSPETMDHYVQDEDLVAHAEDITIHVTQEKQDAWNAKANPSDIPSSLPANGGTAADTTNITSALTLSTAAPTETLAAGKLWGVY